jgi:hypothetical protein
MPCTARASAAGYCYHVLNRGNDRATIFHKPADYQAFLDMMAEAGLRTPHAGRRLLPDAQPLSPGAVAPR